MTSIFLRTLEVLFRYDGYSGDGYYWRIGGHNGQWRGPFTTAAEAEQHAKGVYGD